MNDQRNGPSTSSSSSDPRSDPAIFRTDGTIVFPRSDGDASYGAPNTVAPPASAQEINYFHLLSHGQPKYNRWANLIGTDLAVWAGQPAKPRNGTGWKLAAFPTNYQMTEHRKGPRESYRTDIYLYGSAGHRFRSTKEFLPHAQWLILNDGSPCTCKYCPTGRLRQSNGSNGAGISSPRQKREGPTRPPRFPVSNKKIAPSNSYKVRTQELPSPHDRVSLGITVPSLPLRDSELARTSAVKQSECEGFRIGEIVWAILIPPLIDPDDCTRVIDKWPAQVEDVKMATRVAPLDSPTLDSAAAKQDGEEESADKNHDAFSLKDRVIQERQYDVAFVGAPEDGGRLPETRLLPFLAGFISESVRESSFGSIEDHAWFQSATGFPPKLNLLASSAAEDQKCTFGKLIGALAFALTSCNYMRSRYRVTDPFALPDGVQADAEREDQVLGQPPETGNSKTALPSAEPSTNGVSASAIISPSPKTDRPAETREPASTMTSASPKTDQPAETREPASLAVRGASKGEGGPNRQPQSPRVFRSAKSSTYRGGTFYQGAFVGLERIWVGDVVRLKLREREVKEMMEALAVDGRLARKSDAGVGSDVRGSYIMRVRAMIEEGKSVKVAGSVYQVMTRAEFNAKKAAEQALFDTVPQPQDVTPDAEKCFAFPASSFLHANGQELPAVPAVPAGFLLSQVNAESREVVLDLTKIAGRLYGSLSKLGDAEQLYAMKEIQKLVFGKYLDTKDANMARLSLVGALPGVVKPMEVESWERANGSQLMKQCFDIARGEIYQIIKNHLEKPTLAPLTALAQEANDTITAVAAAAAAAASTIPKGHNDKDKKRKSASDDGGAGASATSKGKRLATSGGISGGTPVRSAAGAASASPTVATSTAKSKSPVKINEGILEDPNLPPLREGWIVQKSRNGHGYFYAHPATKVTTWTRPT